MSPISTNEGTVAPPNHHHHHHHRIQIKYVLFRAVLLAYCLMMIAPVSAQSSSSFPVLNWLGSWLCAFAPLFPFSAGSFPRGVLLAVRTRKHATHSASRSALTAAFARGRGGTGPSVCVRQSPRAVSVRFGHLCRVLPRNRNSGGGYWRLLPRRLVGLLRSFCR